jgi:tRNA A-37 threonylcarbamoyl transferase component Bud32
VSFLPQYRECLPVPLSCGSPVSNWVLRDLSVAACVEEVTPLIQSPKNIEPQHLIKQQTRRLIFRHSIDGQDYLIKAFPLGVFKKRLQYKKYADAEVANILHAKELGIPVPELFGYGRQTDWMLVKWNAVCQEYIDAPNMEDLLFQEQSLEERNRLLIRSFPLFKKLYEAGCNHIDFKPGSILVGNDGKDTVIDFQYVRYLDGPSKLVFAAQAGYFAWDVVIKNRWLEQEAMADWFQHLLDYVGIEDDSQVMSIFSRTSAAKYSIKDRMNGVAGLS